MKILSSLDGGEYWYSCINVHYFLILEKNIRFNEEETTESRTNVIDRTVANFLFSNVEFGASEGSSLDFTEATNIRQHSGGGMLWNISAGSSGCDAPTFSG
uniref:ACI112 n=1 Tax=Solanum tuberosum TaxID=4113 RepID=M0ZUN3_SOLTU